MALEMLHPLAGALPVFVDQHMGWILSALIVVGGLAYGYSDVLRLSTRRMSAIGGVCFAESIRRKVLWIPPLAILGVIIVAQLQRPLDEQDAIRQTTKFCIFATGLVVAMTSVILACTNLPREIENRVIYTVVTKPTTRLEIVVGKVAGFAMVSAAILVIMGIFTYGYLSLRAWSMQRFIAERLESGQVTDSTRATLTHYQQSGLLTSKTLVLPVMREIYARLPETTGDRRYFAGGGEGGVLIPFLVSKQQLTPPNMPDAAPGSVPVAAIVRIGYERQGVEPTTAPAPQAPTAATRPAGPPPYYGPFVIPPEERQKILNAVKPREMPTISIQVMDQYRNFKGAVQSFPNANQPLYLYDPHGLSTIRGVVSQQAVESMADQPIYLRISGGAKDDDLYLEEKAGQDPAILMVPTGPTTVSRISPAGPPTFVGGSGSYGEQLKGGPDAPVAVFSFRDVKFDADATQASFELKTLIERSGSDLPEDQELPTELSVRVRNLADGKISEEVKVSPESNRFSFFSVPAAAVTGGNFDLIMRCTTPGHYLTFADQPISLIAQRQPFVINLAKSLMILWLMAILITAVAIFCSTFLSWPIAIVLTVLILLGHWGVDQLGDSLAPGLGNQFVQDMGFTGSAQSKALSATVEKLSSMLNLLSTVLPDISRFAALEDIERGISVSLFKLADAAAVAFGFGVPLVVLTYVVLRNKEVAP